MSKYKYKKWIQILIREHRNFGTEPGKEFDDTIDEVDEVYAKATAFDAIVEERDHAGKAMYKNEDKPVEIFTDTAFWNIDEIIVDYESGDSE